MKVQISYSARFFKKKFKSYWVVRKVCKMLFCLNSALSSVLNIDSLNTALQNIRNV